MPSNPTPGCPTPQTLAAGVDGSWLDLRSIADDVPLVIVVAGGAVAVIQASFDEAKTKSSDTFTVDSFSVNGTYGRVLIFPHANFVRIRNTGAAGTVMWAVGRSKNATGEPVQISPQTFDTPRTGAFSS